MADAEEFRAELRATSTELWNMADGTLKTVGELYRTVRRYPPKAGEQRSMPICCNVNERGTAARLRRSNRRHLAGEVASVDYPLLPCRGLPRSCRIRPDFPAEFHGNNVSHLLAEVPPAVIRSSA